MNQRARTAEPARRDRGRGTPRQISALKALRDRDPQVLLEELQETVRRVIELPLILLALLRLERHAGARDVGALSWAPRMDAFEEGDDLVIRVDLPGARKDDVQVELDGGSLVIRGQTSTEREQRDRAVYRLERFAGSFYRRLHLPYEVDPEQVEARLEDGVLEVRIPKPAGQREPQCRIRIQ